MRTGGVLGSIAVVVQSTRQRRHLYRAYVSSETATPHKPLMSHRTASFCHSNIVQVRTVAFAFSPQWSGLCFVCRRTSNTPWFCGYRRRTLFTAYEPKCKYQFHESKKFNDEKRPSHADSSGRKCLKKHDGQLTSKTSPSDTFRCFYDTVVITNPTSMQVESASRRNAMQKTQRMDQEDLKTPS